MNKKAKLILIYIFLIILVFFVGGISSIVILNNLGLINNQTMTLGETKETINTNVDIVESDTIKSAIEKIYDAVYVIEVYDKNNNKISSGTGFAYKTNDDIGYIITNYHVIEGGSVVKVIDSKGNTIDAKILGSDSISDIAVLSIPSSSVLLVAEIGDSSKLSLGDTLFTVGSPLGSKYSGTVTKGILSGINRQITVKLTNGNFVMEVLQTDAAINPGNSGGPILNINGEVIGVTSLKLVEDEIEGMGFAIPIELVMSTVSILEKGETINRPLFGVSLVDISKSQLLKRYNINISDNIKEGVIIVNVINDSPASNSNLKVGDVITKINDSKISDTAHFNYNLYKYSVGDTIKITYLRNNTVNSVNVKLTKSLNATN